MPDENDPGNQTSAEERPDGHRALSPAAERALAEAAERRKQAEDAKIEHTREVGRKGPDPARYGDWEKNGIASDF